MTRIATTTASMISTPSSTSNSTTTSPKVRRLFALCSGLLASTVVVAADPVEESSYSAVQGFLRSRYSSTTMGENKQPSSFLSQTRRLEDIGYQGETESEEIGDIFMFLVLILFILALAFPALTLTYSRLCCGLTPTQQQEARDTPPSEVEVVDEPTTDYQFVQQVSSMGSDAPIHQLS